MRFRTLRIAWSVGCGVACLLLTLMWVRSYYVCDTLWLRYYDSHFAWIVPEKGRIVVELSEIRNGQGMSTFAVDHLPIRTVGSRPNNYWIHVIGLGNLTKIYTPLWLSILLFATLAAIPWKNWSKRFSLRTLLIATTLFAAVMGATVYTTRQ